MMWPFPGAPGVGLGSNAPASTLGAGGVATQAEINAFVDGLEQSLTAIERDLIAQVFGDSLPLVGNKFSDAAGQGLQALHHVTGIKAALKSGLGTLNGAATYTRVQVENAVRTALQAASITVGPINVDAGNPTDIRLSISTTKIFAAFSTPLDAGLGIPGLGLSTSGTANTEFSYTFNFNVGVDASGFYLLTANNASAFSVGFKTTVPGLDVSANLSKLRFRLTDESDTDGDSTPSTKFTGTFNLDLLDPSGGDEKLRISELSSDLLNATLTATADLNLSLVSDLDEAAFPAISADLSLGWAFPAAEMTSGDSNSTFGAVPKIAFKNVTLDLGSFFSKFAKPVLAEVREVSEPVQPLIEAVKAPIPLLTDLNAITSYVPTSLLDMAVKSGTITQAQAGNFDILAKVIQISNSIPPGAGVNIKIDLGDFDLGAADPRVPNFNIGGITPNKIRNAALAVAQHPLVADFVNQTNAFPKGVLPGGQMSKGMQFPILDNPQTAFGLLLGKDVDLFTMDNATQNLSLYKIDEFVRLIGPFGFRFKGMGDLRLDMDFGFDTRGLLDFASSGDPLEIFNGFYVLVPKNGSGQAISMAEMNANMRANVAVNAVVAEVGAGGGLYANAKATLTDTDASGRVHLDEFIANFNQSPLCVLNASGSLDFGLQAYVTIGAGPFSYTKDFEFPVGRLFDFSHACGDSPEVILARLQAGEMRLHLGPDAPLRVVGDLSDGADTFELTHRSGTVDDEQIGVTFSGNGGTAGGPGSSAYGPVRGSIRGSGGDSNDTIRLAPDILSPAVLEGNAGIDRLIGAQGNDTLSGGADRDFLFGNGGDDTLLGGEGPDVLQGGPGADIHNGGPGFDEVSYADSTTSVGINLTTGVHTNDAAGDTFIAVEQFEGTRFNDTLIGDAGTNQFFGLAGDDRLEGGEGDDALEGGPGADQLIGGPGQDYTSYFFSPAGVNVNLETGVATGGDAQGDFLESVEHLIGSEYNDTLTGSSAGNNLTGLGGDDIISTGDGVNIVQGGEGKDTITGGPGNDTLYGEGPDTPAFVSADHPDDPFGIQYAVIQQDTLNGGGGRDLIFGGVGVDTVFAGDGDDYIEGGSGFDIIDGGPGDDYVVVIPDIRLPPQEPPILPFPQHLPYPRFEGNTLVGMGGDLVQGGPGIDTVDLSNMMVRGFYSRTQSNVFGVVVNLTTGAGANGAQECTILGFENIIGTDAGDDLTGTDGPNIFQPLRGGGLFSHATGGPDRIDGLGGVDTLIIDFSRFDLAGAPGVYTNGFDIGRVGYDRYLFSNIEQLQITGASKNDMIYNTTYGNNDILNGLAGDDFLGGRSGSDILRGGEGNDTITGNGAQSLDRYGVTDGRDILEGGPGDDVIEDVAFQFGTGAPMLAAGTVLQIDGGPGYDKISANFSNQPVPILWHSATPTDWEFADGAFARNFEEIDTIITGSGNDFLTQLGRTNNSFYLGEGDDVANPGVGIDVVVGGPGNDLLIVDWSTTDGPDVGGVYYNDAYRRQSTANPNVNLDALRLYEFERIQFTGGSKADTLYGGDDNDILIGLGGNDTLTGFAGNDRVEGGDGDDTIKSRSYRSSAPSTQVLGGAGNDTFVCDFYDGAPTVGYGSDTVDMGDGNDEMTVLYYYFNGNSVATYAINGQIQRYDGGPGDDIGSADFGNQIKGMEFIEGQDNMIDFPDGSWFRHFEHIRYFISGSGNDRFVFTGRATRDIATGAGNDVVDGGQGFTTLVGGPGEDTLIVNFSLGDDPDVGGGTFEPGNASYRRFNSGGALVDQIRPVDFERLHFIGSSKADNISGTNDADILIGNGGNDTFNGNGGNDFLVACLRTGARGAAEIDRLNGGGGADVFALGDATGKYYDDNIPGTPGQEGYANITDFNPAQGDRLQLYGNLSEYLLGPSPISGIAGTALFHDSNGNGALEPASDELIATLGTQPITAANTLTPDSVVTAPAFARINLAGVQPVSTGSGPDQRFALTFSIMESIPAGLILEVQSSRDLGAADPWHTIASKSGPGAWTGPATVTSSSPSGGKVTVTVPVLPSAAAGPRQYLRLALSSY